MSNKFRWQCARVWVFSIQTYMRRKKNVKKYCSLFALFLSNGRKKALKLFMNVQVHQFSQITVKSPIFIYPSYKYFFLLLFLLQAFFTVNLSTSRGAYFLYFCTTIKSAFQFFLYIHPNLYIIRIYVCEIWIEDRGCIWMCFFTLKSLKHYKRLFTQ